jgi:ankyrin repeat protein
MGKHYQKTFVHQNSLMRTKNQSACIKILLDLGADPNAFNDQNSTPLHFACSAKGTKMLLQRGALPHLKNKAGVTPLFCALIDHLRPSYPRSYDLIYPEKPFYNVASVLLADEADINDTYYDETLLSFAVTQKDIKLTDFLLKNGADSAKLNNSEIDCKSPHFLDLCKDLQPDRNNSLNRIIVDKNEPVVRELLNRDIDYLKKDTDGKTAIQLASESGQADIIKLFNNKINNDIITTVESGDFNRFKKLLKYIPDINAILRLSIHTTLLHEACQLLPKKWACKLLAAGANINARNIHGKTPLYDVVYSKKRNINRILFFVNQGAKIEQDIFEAPTYKWVDKEIKALLEKLYAQQQLQKNK